MKKLLCILLLLVQYQSFGIPTWIADLFGTRKSRCYRIVEEIVAAITTKENQDLTDQFAQDYALYLEGAITRTELEKRTRKGFVQLGERFRSDNCWDFEEMRHPSFNEFDDKIKSYREQYRKKHTELLETIESNARIGWNQRHNNSKK